MYVTGLMLRSGFSVEPELELSIDQGSSLPAVCAVVRVRGDSASPPIVPSPDWDHGLRCR